MARYVTLVQWTPLGLSRLDQLPERIQRKHDAFRDAGGELLEFYLVLGGIDAVAISEMPSDEAYFEALLSLEAMGYFIATTVKVYPETEYLSIAQSERRKDEEIAKLERLSI